VCVGVCVWVGVCVCVCVWVWVCVCVCVCVCVRASVQQIMLNLEQSPWRINCCFMIGASYIPCSKFVENHFLENKKQPRNIMYSAFLRHVSQRCTQPESLSNIILEETH
jgi:hypothetical protein